MLEFSEEESPIFTKAWKTQPDRSGLKADSETLPFFQDIVIAQLMCALDRHVQILMLWIHPE